MSVTVSTVDDDGELKEWDEYLQAHPDACVFQTRAWRQAVEAAYGHRPYYLMARQGGKICGVLPLFFIDSPFFGRVLSTSPYAAAHGAVCADGEDPTRALVEAAVRLCGDLRAEYLELKSLRATQYPGLHVHGDYVDYRLALDEPDAMWARRLKHSTRKFCRQADGFGLRYEQGHHLLGVFHHLFSVGMRRLGTPVHSKAFYENILSAFGSRAQIAVVRHQDAPIAALLTLTYKMETIPHSEASLSEYWHMRPNNFLYWEAVKAAYLAGSTTYDFGRSLAGSGHAQFKESWGAEATPLSYEYFLNRAKAMPRINQDNPRYRLARSAWKRLPLGLTQWLGPRLIKDVS